jgi:hypothetical protein
MHELDGRTVSLDDIIEELYRDNGYQEDIPEGDMEGWATDALKFIRAVKGFIPKVIGDKADTAFDVKNYRVQLPCDFYMMGGVALNGVIARYSGDTFHHLTSDECCTLFAGTASGGEIIDNFRNMTIGNTSLTGPNVYSAVSPDNENRFYENDVTYKFVGGCIQFNVKEGKACLAYVAMPSDEKGRSLIPDDISYIEAVKRYMTMKLDYIGWRRGTLTADIYSHSETQWYWYLAQAANVAKGFNLDSMESLKNFVQKLGKSNRHHSKGFKLMGRGGRYSA